MKKKGFFAHFWTIFGPYFRVTFCITFYLIMWGFWLKNWRQK